MPGTIELRVRYAETDQMGRAHHSHYIVWCEMGRTDLMRSHGASYAELERQGILLPVARVEIDYRKPVFYDDEVRVETEVRSVKSRSVTFGYTLFRSRDGELIARATTMLVCMDRDGKTRRFPEPVAEALQGAAA